MSHCAARRRGIGSGSGSPFHTAASLLAAGAAGAGERLLVDVVDWGDGVGCYSRRVVSIAFARSPRFVVRYRSLEGGELGVTTDQAAVHVLLLGSRASHMSSAALRFMGSLPAVHAPVLGIVGICATTLKSRCLYEMGVTDVLRFPLSNGQLRLRIAAVVAHDLNSRDAMRSAAVLDNILSLEVREGLKRGEHKVLRYHECVTVFYSNMVGYSDLCQQFNIQEMLDVMHELFSLLDELAGAMGVTKVDTVGDAYMAVTGCDATSRAEQVTRMLRFSEGAMDAARAVMLSDGRSIQLRVGVSSGPAMSGVIGLTRPHFCFFGNTVNLASRLEATSAPTRVHVSGASVEMMRGEQSHGYAPDLVPSHGLIDVEGFGVMETWFLCCDENDLKAAREAARTTAIRTHSLDYERSPPPKLTQTPKPAGGSGRGSAARAEADAPAEAPEPRPPLIRRRTWDRGFPSGAGLRI
jgi:class 3 adenylate cyclase